MGQSIIVWDIETVPDLRGFAAANGLEGKSDEEVREALGEKFPKHVFHSVVCIGALVAHREAERLRYLHDCSGCFRLERLPGRPCTHWKAPPFHGARHLRTNALQQQRLYSITSSARAESMGWTSMPSVFAVFKLITNSNLVVCTTGRSIVLAPPRTFPV
jgi:hypothetical protein